MYGLEKTNYAPYNMNPFRNLKDYKILIQQQSENENGGHSHSYMEKGHTAKNFWPKEGK
jgi:hypothetical protein